MLMVVAMSISMVRVLVLQIITLGLNAIDKRGLVTMVSMTLILIY